MAMSHARLVMDSALLRDVTRHNRVSVSPMVCCFVRLTTVSDDKCIYVI